MNAPISTVPAALRHEESSDQVASLESLGV
jgi:hypothetical protein